VYDAAGSFVITKDKRNAVCEKRITMEIVVNIYESEEQAMGWYYYLYLQDIVQFPFTATCITKWRISRLKKGATVK